MNVSKHMISIETCNALRADEVAHLTAIKVAAQALSDNMKPSMQVQGEKMYALFDVKLVGELRKVLKDNDDD